MKSEIYRNDLPKMPQEIRELDIRNGVPVPWFRMQSQYYTYDQKVKQAVMEDRCWICGKPFREIMCYALRASHVISKTSYEPVSHLECAKWMIESITKKDFSLMVCLWVINSAEIAIIKNGHHFLFDLSKDPLAYLWYTKGRTAHKQEVLHEMEEKFDTIFKSIESNYVDIKKQLIIQAKNHKEELITKYMPER